MRVTGSMMIVCRGMIYPNFAAGFGMLSVQQFAQHREDQVRRGRAAGHENIHRHDFVHRPHDRQQRRNHLARNLRVQRGVLQVRAAAAPRSRRSGCASPGRCR